MIGWSPSLHRGLTWRQKIVLRAASNVDYLPFRALRQTNIPHGTYRSLVIYGYLRHHKGGWEITPEGRELAGWWTEKELQQARKEERRYEQRHRDAEDFGEQPRRNAG